MIRKYYRRRDKFLAVQFFASNYRELRELTRGRLFYDAALDRYLLFTQGHEFIMKDGDYIVEEKEVYEVWTEDVFESLFEIVPGQGED